MLQGAPFVLPSMDLKSLARRTRPPSFVSTFKSRSRKFLLDERQKREYNGQYLYRPKKIDADGYYSRAWARKFARERSSALQSTLKLESLFTVHVHWLRAPRQALQRSVLCVSQIYRSRAPHHALPHVAVRFCLLVLSPLSAVEWHVPREIVVGWYAETIV